MANKNIHEAALALRNAADGIVKDLANGELMEAIDMRIDRAAEAIAKMRAARGLENIEQLRASIERAHR